MTDAPERFNDTERNLIINQTVDKLERIINDHDPETDVPIKQGVWDCLDKMAVAIETRAAAPAPAVKVKPLVWWVSDTGDMCVDTILGRYQIQKGAARYCMMPAMGGKHRPQAYAVPTYHRTLETAKAAAQADYEARILAALEPAPAVKVKALVWEEKRNGYWQAKGTGYQIAHNQGDVYRVRLGGKVICRRINGFENAKHWVFAHHSAAILAALEPAPAVDPMSDPRVVALVEALKKSRNTHCAIAEHCLENKPTTETAPIFADSQRARLAIDAALAALDPQP